MQPAESFMRKYYTDEAWAKRADIRKQATPEKLEANRDAWRQLFLKVEAVLSLNPAKKRFNFLRRNGFFWQKYQLQAIPAFKLEPLRLGKITRTGPCPSRMRFLIVSASIRVAIEMRRYNDWKKLANL